MVDAIVNEKRKLTCKLMAWEGKSGGTELGVTWEKAGSIFYSFFSFRKLIWSMAIRWVSAAITCHRSLILASFCLCQRTHAYFHKKRLSSVVRFTEILYLYSYILLTLIFQALPSLSHPLKPQFNRLFMWLLHLQQHQ